MPNLLIEHGAKISDEDIDRAFDSHFIYNRQSEVYKSLITLGADINRKDEYGRTPLVRSAINNDENAFEFLLKNGADITIVDNENKTVSDYAKGKVAEILKSHTENKHLDALIDVESDEEEFDFFNSPPPASYQTLYEKETLKNKDLMAALDAKDEVIDELATALAKSEKANTLLISINNNQAKLLGQNKTQEVAPVATKAAVIERE
jgi:ankyrin repeat protein